MLGIFLHNGLPGWLFRNTVAQGADYVMEDVQTGSVDAVAMIPYSRIADEPLDAFL